MKHLKTFVSAVLAGACIAWGGTMYLSMENRVLGALFFTVGIFIICTFGFHLFTGKVCYSFDCDRHYPLILAIVWAGNFCGTWLVAQAERATRVGIPLAEKAAVISAVKLNDTLLSIFILSIFCNIMIYVAVEGFRSNPQEVGKYLALFFGIMVFILSGFEHCVANMYYFSMAGVWGGRALLYLLVMTLGNAVGGVLLPLLRGFIRGDSKA